MEATSSDRKTLQITENGELLGELVYENMFLLKAQIRLPDSELYELSPAGIFWTSINVRKNDLEIANLKMNWRGQIVFAFEYGREFILKATGLFSNKFILENKDGEKLIQFDPKFNWSKFDYNYDISHGKRPQDIFMVLLGVYASNYFITMMSGGSSGMG